MKLCCDRINVKEYPVYFRKILRMTSRRLIFFLLTLRQEERGKIHNHTIYPSKFKEVKAQKT